MARQISVFLENKPGRLASIMDLFSSHGIRLLAMGIAEAGNYGIVRCVVDSPEKAVEALRGATTAVNITEVIIIDLRDLQKAVKSLGDGGVNIDYAYTMDMGRIVLKVNDQAKAVEILSKAGIIVHQLA